MKERPRAGLSRVALTGGRGFVGSALLRSLSESGVKVRCFSRTAPGDSRGEWLVRKTLDVEAATALLEGVEVVFHCVGSFRDEENYVPANVNTVRTMAPLAAKLGVRWVHLGSLGVFNGRDQGIITEESEICPIGPYEESKGEADGILLSEAERNGLAVSILRPAAIVGSKMPSPWLRNLTAFLSRRRSFLVAGGAGLLCLSPLPSVVEALKACGSIAAGGPRVFHLAQSISFKRLLLVCRNSSRKPAFAPSIPEWLARVVARGGRWIPGFPLTPSRIDIFTRTVEFPSEKIVGELGYEEKYPIEQFLADLLLAWSGLP
jgi:nucleoside-diphosphate-sugar epimerase